MIIIADTSVVSNLAIIGKASLLPQMFRDVVIPEAVRSELQVGAATHAAVASVLSEGWLKCCAASDRKAVEHLMSELDMGEAEAIVLAQELKADLLLMDERRGRRVAERLGLNLTGIIGVLLQAKASGWIAAVRPCVEDLRGKARFWINQSVFDDCLRIAGELT